MCLNQADGMKGDGMKHCGDEYDKLNENMGKHFFAMLKEMSNEIMVRQDFDEVGKKQLKRYVDLPYEKLTKKEKQHCILSAYYGFQNGLEIMESVLSKRR